MAKAFKCDMCGKLEEAGPVALFSLISPDENFYMRNCKIDNRKNAEICVACLHKLTKTKPL